MTEQNIQEDDDIDIKPIGAINIPFFFILFFFFEINSIFFFKSPSSLSLFL